MDLISLIGRVPMDLIGESSSREAREVVLPYLPSGYIYQHVTH